MWVYKSWVWIFNWSQLNTVFERRWKQEKLADYETLLLKFWVDNTLLTAIKTKESKNLIETLIYAFFCPLVATILECSMAQMGGSFNFAKKTAGERDGKKFNYLQNYLGSGQIRDYYVKINLVTPSISAERHELLLDLKVI